MLEQDYSEDLDTEQAINLAMSIFLKTLDTQTLKWVPWWPIEFPFIEPVLILNSARRKSKFLLLTVLVEKCNTEFYSQTKSTDIVKRRKTKR